MNKDIDSQEIDLKIYYNKLITFILANRKGYALFIILMIIFSAIIFSILKPRYKSTFAVTSHCFSISKIKIPLNNLVSLLEDGNYEMLAPKLKIPEDAAKTIKSIDIEVETDDNDNTPTNPLYKGSICSIIIVSTDSSKVKEIKKGLLDYVTSNPYINNIVRLEILGRDSLESHIIKEKRTLDSLNTLTIGKFSSMKNGVVMMEDLAVIQKAIFVLEERILDIRRTRELVSSGLWEVNELIVVRMSIWLNLSRSIILGSFASILSLLGINFLFKKKKFAN